MTVLEFINELIEQGYSEEDAEKICDFAFSDEWQSDEDEERI